MKLLRKFKRKSRYKKSLIIFTIIMSILSIIFLGYVWNSMVIYERGIVDNYIKYLVDSGKITDSISNDLFEVSDYEVKGGSIKEGVKKLLKREKVEIKKNKELSNDTTFSYDLEVFDQVISTISLKRKNTYKRMAILNIEEWVVEDIKTYFDKGIYNYEIKVPVDHKVYLNNLELSDKEIVKSSDVEGLEKITEYVEVEKSKVYEVNNLIYEGDIKILNAKGKEVEYKKDLNKIWVSTDFKKISTGELESYLKSDFDILELAKNWSLFLTDDLSGSYHGFYTLTPYLIRDSYMYNMAYEWSHGVDITFVSSHRLKEEVFTKERIDNIIIYNDLAFSAEVYLEKNMVVSGKDKVDVMHDRLYFVYIDGGYKLVGMEAITD